MSLPGVHVGPLDPEATKDFGQVSANRSARRLIRLHVSMYPPDLHRALSKRPNEPRTRGLRLSEVRDAIEVPEGHVIVGATIRGTEDDADKVLTYTYVHGDAKKARSVKWYVPLVDVADDIPSSMELGDQLAVIAENRELGLLSGAAPAENTASPTGSANLRTLERQLGEANARADKLSQELQERDAAQVIAAAEDTPGGEPPESDEPFEGYDELSASDVADKLADADAETRAAVLSYEEAHKNRVTVLRAAEAPQED